MEWYTFMTFKLYSVKLLKSHLEKWEIIALQNISALYEKQFDDNEIGLKNMERSKTHTYIHTILA